MPTDLSAYNNDWYRPGPLWKRGAWFVINSIFFKHSLLPFSGLKRGLLRLFGAQIGYGVIIKNNVNIKYPWLLQVGNHCWIGEGVWIDNLGMVTLGNNVCLSQAAMLLCGNHDYSSSSFDLMVKPIVLEDGVWIGARAVVCGGVTCRTHVVLTVQSVAVKDLDAWYIYQGNPCEKIKLREMHK